MTTLYNIRHDGDQFRISKFVDGEVESSYLTSERECDCPAGHRHTCRHRSMLPDIMPIANTHWFWDFDRREVVDIAGAPKAYFDLMMSEEAIKHMDSEPAGPHSEHTAAHDLLNLPSYHEVTVKAVDNLAPPSPQPFRRRI